MKLMKVTDPEKVLEIIFENFGPLEAEYVPLAEAAGRCLAEDVPAPEDIPAFNRSTVDGYAVKAQDTFGASETFPALVDCVGEVLMGKEAPDISEGECTLIHTGGMLPGNADAVVMVEDTDSTGNTINIFRQAAPGSNVIHRGEDLAAGSTALIKKILLRSPEIGLLASIGVQNVKVYRQPVIGVLSTGDELVSPETKALTPGKVRDSNSPALTYLGELYGAKVINGGILPDIYDDFFRQSHELLEKVDFLVLSGGSSVGTRDFTARTLQELGDPGLLVEGISIQPGKPTLLANCGGKPVMGLPGHPVSALNIFSVFGKRVIQTLTGLEPERIRPAVQAILSRNIPSRSGRTDFIRVKLEFDEAAGERKANGKNFVANSRIMAVPVFGRSGMLRTLAEADGYIVIEAAKEGLSEGTPVSVYPIE